MLSHYFDSYESQINILIEYYKKVDNSKNRDEVIGIINRRRPKDTPKGNKIPTGIIKMDPYLFFTIPY